MSLSGDEECNEFGLFTFLERGNWNLNIFSYDLDGTKKFNT